MDSALSVNGHRWMVPGVGTVVEDGFRPCSVPAIQHRQTVRGRPVSLRAYTIPVHPVHRNRHQASVHASAVIVIREAEWSCCLRLTSNRNC